jgi:hypothetical protein
MFPFRNGHRGVAMRLLVGERLKHDVRFEGQTPLEAALVNNFPDMAVLLQRLPVQLLCAVCDVTPLTEYVVKSPLNHPERIVCLCMMMNVNVDD